MSRGTGLHRKSSRKPVNSSVLLTPIPTSVPRPDHVIHPFPSELQPSLRDLYFPLPHAPRSSSRRTTPHVPKPPIVVGLSDIGKARTRNEDSLCIIPERGVAVVADGMGGHPGGDVASRIAAETAARLLGGPRDTGGSGEDATRRLRAAMSRSVVAAHEAIRAHGRQEPELEGMGTTLTAMIVDADTGTWVLGHVGDSRAYLFRGGRLTQLTRDDTWVQERVEAAQLTREQARRHPFGHLLTQCLGLEEPPVPHILGGRTEAGDAYLLCTDGLVGMLDDPELERILAEHLVGNGGGSAADAPVRALLEAANEAGGHDNITAALVRIA